MESKALVLADNSHNLNQEMIDTLVQGGIIPHGTPKAQIDMFAQVCKDKALSPFSKEIYLMSFGGVYSRIVGIDGFRKIAARTKELAGCDDVKFDIKSDGTWSTSTELIAKGVKLPTSATFTVYRIVGGMRVPFTHTAVFSEFTSGKNKWATMPFQMISKVAEAFAYKKGFSDETSGLNVEEESAAFENGGKVIDVEVVSSKIEERQLPEMTRAHFDQYVYCKLTGDEENAALIEKSVIITDKWKPYVLRDIAKSRLNPESDFETIQALKDGDLDATTIANKFFFTAKELAYYSNIFKQRQEEKANG